MQLGDIKKVEFNGRVIIPSPVRNLLNLHPGTSVNIYVEDNRCIIERCDEKRGEKINGKTSKKQRIK